MNENIANHLILITGYDEQHAFCEIYRMNEVIDFFTNHLDDIILQVDNDVSIVTNPTSWDTSKEYAVREFMQEVNGWKKKILSYKEEELFYSAWNTAIRYLNEFWEPCSESGLKSIRQDL